MWAIIGGSGFEKFEDFKTLEELDRETPFGLASSGFKKVELQGKELIFISRHGQHHELTPSEVNYRANIYALKKMGVKNILSVSAVGSLRQDLKPGDMVIPSQYIDRTKSLRKHTFCEKGIVGHVSLANPTSKELTLQCEEIVSKLDFDVHFNKTYICIEGPYFSTFAESNMYRTLGADIIGMTNFPEYALAREAGISYLPCSFVTDYDCWNLQAPHVTLEEVIKIMKQNNSKAFQLAQKLLDKLHSYETNTKDREGLQTGLMTPYELVDEKDKQWLDVLLK